VLSWLVSTQGVSVSKREALGGGEKERARERDAFVFTGQIKMMTTSVGETAT